MGIPGVKVAVLDSGVDKDHPDLGVGTDGYMNVNASLGWDYVNNTNYSTPTFYHGTFVAGIIGAKTNNSIGIAGISGGNHQAGVTIIPYRIAEGIYFNSNVVDDAILAAVTRGVKVINMSFGSSSSEAISSAIEYAYLLLVMIL